MDKDSIQKYCDPELLLMVINVGNHVTRSKRRRRKERKEEVREEEKKRDKYRVISLRHGI